MKLSKNIAEKLMEKSFLPSPNSGLEEQESRIVSSNFLFPRLEKGLGMRAFQVE
ncbi:hypothetical protein IQ249_09010 [Lusitaniella coriacea LEGE 07157]|uniref:Uncharacterized protein n=1 Tax=Lusitaniella coriacea LEGE 07157 TaxID=945747 RepID=A0A8J7DVV3_9CYAN|nr:hypothetical protein [Lusitaniella coriacea]MBE9116032.1 hypothetical protein [Lusitaniella coriacea LEGE 07157]